MIDPALTIGSPFYATSAAAALAALRPVALRGEETD